MADNEIVYEIRAKIDDINKKLDGIDSKANNVGGKSGGISKISASLAAIGPVAAAAAAAYVGYFITNGIKKGIEAAQIQEDAINKMNASLMSAGRFSRDASADLQNYASELQKVTRIGDEATLGNIALATAFTKTNEQTKKLVSAAVDMAQALNISVDSAIRNLGGSLSGMTGMLARLLPQVTSLTKEQLKAGGAIDLVASSFSGAASAAANTFSGRLDQLSNAWGDFYEIIGNFFIKSPSIIAAINYIKDVVVNLSDKLNKFRENSGDIFKPILIGAIDFVGFMNSVFGPVINFGINVVSNLVTWVGNLSGALLKLIQGDFSGAFQQYKSAFVEGFKGITETFNFAGVEAFNSFLNGGRRAILEGAMTIRDPIKSTLNNVVNDMGKTSKKIIDYGQIIASGMANAMNALGTTLVKGGLSFGSFAKIALGFIGDFAIQLGTMIITSALAIDALKASILTFGGIGFALAAGAALIAVGAALKAFAGGPAGAGVAGAAQASQAGVNDVGNELTINEDTQPAEKQTNVVVNIEGNVLGDKRTLGKEIAEALNEAFEQDGVRIVGGITA